MYRPPNALNPCVAEREVMVDIDCASDILSCSPGDGLNDSAHGTLLAYLCGSSSRGRGPVTWPLDNGFSSFCTMAEKCVYCMWCDRRIECVFRIGDLGVDDCYESADKRSPGQSQWSDIGTRTDHRNWLCMLGTKSHERGILLPTHSDGRARDIVNGRLHL